MKKAMLDAVRGYAEGQLSKHKMNVEVYLSNPTGIGEHPGVMEALTSELQQMAEYDDILEVLDKYFGEE